MKVHKYKNYDEYVNCQRSAFERKYNNIWAVEENIKAIAKYLLNERPLNGICHGVRQGFEQRWFMKYLTECAVMGTDIGDIEDDTGLTIQWDFNKENPDWINQFDFVYSNSFDHAFSPEKTFLLWTQQTKKGGCVILEYDRRQEHTGEISMKQNKTDPVSLRFDELLELGPVWSPVVEVDKILEMPVITQEWRRAVVFRRVK